MQAEQPDSTYTMVSGPGYSVELELVEVRRSRHHCFQAKLTSDRS